MSVASRTVAGALAAGVTAGLVAAIAPPASAAPTAKYRAVKSCKHNGRSATGVIRTTGKPTRAGQLTTLVNWSYGIQKAGGNTRNSTVEAGLVRWHNALGWRHVSGIGVLHKKAVEDGKWHRGPQSHYPHLGYGGSGELAVRISIAFDGDNGRTCSVILRARDLKAL